MKKIIFAAILSLVLGLNSCLPNSSDEISVVANYNFQSVALIDSAANNLAIPSYAVVRRAIDSAVLKHLVDNKLASEKTYSISATTLVELETRLNAAINTDFDTLFGGVKKVDFAKVLAQFGDRFGGNVTIRYGVKAKISPNWFKIEPVTVVRVIYIAPVGSVWEFKPMAGVITPNVNKYEFKADNKVAITVDQQVVTANYTIGADGDYDVAAAGGVAAHKLHFCSAANVSAAFKSSIESQSLYAKK